MMDPFFPVPAWACRARVASTACQRPRAAETKPAASRPCRKAARPRPRPRAMAEVGGAGAPTPPPGEPAQRLRGGGWRAARGGRKGQPEPPGRKAGREAGGAGRLSRAGADAVAGGLAGSVSRFVVGPLDVVKIRLQVQLEPVAEAVKGAVAAPQGKYRGMWHALRTIFREEGVRGLFRGQVPGQLLTVPYCAVQVSARPPSPSSLPGRADRPTDSPAVRGAAQVPGAGPAAGAERRGRAVGQRRGLRQRRRGRGRRHRRVLPLRLPPDADGRAGRAPGASSSANLRPPPAAPRGGRRALRN